MKKKIHIKQKRSVYGMSLMSAIQNKKIYWIFTENQQKPEPRGRMAFYILIYLLLFYHSCLWKYKWKVIKYNNFSRVYLNRHNLSSATHINAFIWTFSMKKNEWMRCVWSFSKRSSLVCTSTKIISTKHRIIYYSQINFACKANSKKKKKKHKHLHFD